MYCLLDSNNHNNSVVIIIIAMSILTCQNFVVEGMSYEAQEVQVREEFSSQKLLCETQQHVE